MHAEEADGESKPPSWLDGEIDIVSKNESK